MKSRLFAAAVIMSCLSLLVYGTTAFFTAEDTAHNVITSGGIEIELREWADEEKTTLFPENGVSGVMPGTAVTKIVEAKNTGSSAAWVRVSVEKAIMFSDGVEGDVDLDLIALDFDETRWTLGEDGYYYYQEALAPGAVTGPLFTAVSFDSSVGNLYQNSTVTVDVTVYAVQTANNGATALKAQGWPEE
ncbi:hypothetical protein [Hominifimenecus sp. rT4P-3]|uniref:hypothetical protein n=1 Tax=Hominifimenecus sp. rT4P-3 TaxID=3242979 RepID=UPI003DA26924